MIFGKKQRYIEVFQCSGDDMNMVLHGASFQPQAAKPPLLSPGMLPQTNQPTPQAAIPLNVAQPQLTLSIPTAAQPPSNAIIAQQQAQAQFIAQQNLLVRQQAVAYAQAAQAAQQQQAQVQAQNEQYLLQQLAGFYSPPTNIPPPNMMQANQPATVPNHMQNNMSYGAPQMPPQFVFMPRSMGLTASFPSGYLPQLGGIPYGSALPTMGSASLPPSVTISPVSPTYSTALGVSATSPITASSSGKRSYDNAFRGEQTIMTNAKRHFAPQTTTMYSHFYPPPM